MKSPTPAQVPNQKRKFVELKEPSLLIRKPRDTLVRSQFVIECRPDGKYQVTCKHCKDDEGNSLFTRAHQTINVTKLRGHILYACAGVPMSIKSLMLDQSALTKKARALACVTNVSAGGTMADDSLSDMRQRSMSDLSKRTLAKNVQTKIVLPAFSGRIQRMNEYEAMKIIGREVEAIVARMEPLSRLIDPIVQAAMIGANPAIATFLPSTEETIFNQYIPRMDERTTSDLTALLKTIPGMMTVAFDGATFTSKSKVRFVFI